IAPCLPTKTDKLPSGSQWLHEIKHDGFRIIARKDGPRVRLYSRPGNDLTRRFPLIVEALARRRSRSCIIDGEAVACDDNGVASFDLVRHQRANESIFLYAFDLIELNGDDLRRDPLEVRKATLASIVAKARPGIRFNEHIEGDGPTIFARACKMGRSHGRPRYQYSGPSLGVGWRTASTRSSEFVLLRQTLNGERAELCILVADLPKFNILPLGAPSFDLFHNGITRDQARRLIGRIGNNRAKLGEAAR